MIPVDESELSPVDRIIARHVREAIKEVRVATGLRIGVNVQWEPLSESAEVS